MSEFESEIFKVVAEAIKSPKLYNEYINKRNLYINDLSQSKNKTVQQKIVLAIVVTDICMEVCANYLATVANLFAKLAKQQNEQNEADEQTRVFLQSKFESSVNEFKKAIQSNASESFSDFLKQDLEFTMSTWSDHSAASKTILKLSSFQFYAYSWSILYTYSSLLKIMQSRDSKTAIEAFEIFIKFTLGLIPIVGNVITIQELLVTLKERKERVQAASDLLNELDNFYFSAYNLCLFMQVIIDHWESFIQDKVSLLGASGKPNKSALEAATKKMKARAVNLSKKMAIASKLGKT